MAASVCINRCSSVNQWQRAELTLWQIYLRKFPLHKPLKPFTKTSQCFTTCCLCFTWKNWVFNIQNISIWGFSISTSGLIFIYFVYMLGARSGNVACFPAAAVLLLNQGEQCVFIKMLYICSHQQMRTSPRLKIWNIIWMFSTRFEWYQWRSTQTRDKWVSVTLQSRARNHIFKCQKKKFIFSYS